MEKIKAIFHKKTLSIIGLLAWFLIVFATGLWLNWKKMPKTNPLTLQKSESQMQVFVLKDDGVYLFSSQSSDAEKLPISTQILGERQGAPYAVGGINQTKMYYLTAVENKKYTSLHLYDLDTKTDSEIVSVEGKNELRDLIVSPDGSRIAYISGERTNYEIDQKSSEEIVIRDTQSGDVIDSYTHENEFESLNLKNWMDPNRLVFSRAWEGEGYYLYEVNSTKDLKDAPGLGFSGMGGNNRVVLQNDLGQYGFQDNQNSEMTGITNSIDGAFFRTDEKATPQFLSNHEIIEMLPIGDQFYYLAKISERKDEWQNYGVDIFRVNQSGTQIERLTQVGESGIKIKNLKPSVDGRFLAYESYYSSDIVSENIDTIFAASSSWVYDTQLGKSYKVSDNALFPTVIWKQ